MIQRNPHIANFHSAYLFPEIKRRTEAFTTNQPFHKPLISLGVGDTTRPLVASAVAGIVGEAHALGTEEGYRGYGESQGSMALRLAIADRLYQGRIHPHEITISDGIKSDLARLQQLFGKDVSIALQDPAYPVYVDNAVLAGAAGPYDTVKQGYRDIYYLPCNPENQFFPDLNRAPRTDLILICSPNNPTGTVATHDQLTALVQLARKNNSIIIFDAAYAAFIQDPELPRSIYEIDGAEKVSIEINSFSKLAGFTGIRLGWTVIPKTLHFNDSHPVYKDWSRVCSTIFNGASRLSEAGGLSLLTQEGLAASRKIIQSYLDQAKQLKQAVESAGLTVFGGKHAPYLWVHFPGRKSWDVFDQLLETVGLITTPGIGYGPSGEGFIRLSALGKQENTKEAVARLQTVCASAFAI